LSEGKPDARARISSVRLEIPDPPPPLDSGTQRKILKRLERATKLARKRKISDLHHAAIGLDAVMRLYGDAGRGSEYSIRGRRFDTFELAGKGWATLMSRTALDEKEATERYGEFVGFVATLRDHQGRMRELGDKELEWDEEMENVLDEGLLRLRSINRLQFRMEERLERRAKFFPRLSALTNTAAVAMGAAVIGALLTGTCDRREIVLRERPAADHLIAPPFDLEDGGSTTGAEPSPRSPGRSAQTPIAPRPDARARVHAWRLILPTEPDVRGRPAGAPRSTGAAQGGSDSMSCPGCRGLR
jgi:hypothetical protein